MSRRTLVVRYKPHGTRWAKPPSVSLDADALHLLGTTSDVRVSCTAAANPTKPWRLTIDGKQVFRARTRAEVFEYASLDTLAKFMVDVRTS